MLSKVSETEEVLQALLSLHRQEYGPGPELLTAAKKWSREVWKAAEILGPVVLSSDEMTRGLHLAQHPVFICGVHRSGTTLVRDLLDGHSELTVIPSEGTYFTQLELKLQALPAPARPEFLGMEWIRRLANPINQPPYWLLGRSREGQSPYVDFARYLLAWWEVLRQETTTQWPHIAVILAHASCTGGTCARYWVDKTPANEHFLKRIWQEMPGARIIHVIREPLATLTSRKKMEPGFRIRKVLQDLKISFSIAAEHADLKDPRFFLLRYEALCEAPREMMASLAAFLDIGYADTLQLPTVAGMPAQANSSFNKKASAGQILKPSQHPQDAVLTKIEHLLLTVYLGNLAGKLNYG